MTENNPGRNIRLRIAYDGTDFSGWQKQAGRRTVQGRIEDALEKIHRKPIKLTGSGRTDAGVHAAGQVANFYTDIDHMEGRRFVPALNSLLPQDVRVLSAEEVPPAFHARFDAKSRMYRYFLICGRAALPMENRYAHQIWRRPNIERLNDAARLFRGETDCSIFAALGDASRSRNRYIYGARFFPQGDTLVFEINANAFLWKMVRSIIGSLLFWEERGIEPQALRDLIKGGDRSLAGPTLPAKGLFLWHIEYFRTPPL